MTSSSTGSRRTNDAPHPYASRTKPLRSCAACSEACGRRCSLHRDLDLSVNLLGDVIDRMNGIEVTSDRVVKRVAAVGRLDRHAETPAAVP